MGEEGDYREMFAEDAERDDMLLEQESQDRARVVYDEQEAYNSMPQNEFQ
jgi:hypothetical protein